MTSLLLLPQSVWPFCTDRWRKSCDLRVEAGRRESKSTSGCVEGRQGRVSRASASWALRLSKPRFTTRMRNIPLFFAARDFSCSFAPLPVRTIRCGFSLRRSPNHLRSARFLRVELPSPIVESLGRQKCWTEPGCPWQTEGWACGVQ